MKILTRKGASLTEYGMLVGLIAVVAITAVALLGGETRDTFGQVTNTLSSNIATSNGQAGNPGTPTPTTPPEEALTIAATQLPGIAGVYGFCRHSNCYNQHGTVTVTEQTNWNIVGLWFDDRNANKTMGMMVDGNIKAAIDADHAYELQCDGGPVMPFDSADYASSTQANGANFVTYVHFSAVGAPLVNGVTSSCEIRSTS